MMALQVDVLWFVVLESRNIGEPWGKDQFSFQRKEIAT